MISQGMSPANWFYVSDSYTLTIGYPSTTLNPGVFNMSLLMGPNQAFKVFVKSCSLETIPFVTPWPTQGINTDVKVGMYQIATTAMFVSTLGFCPPYGISSPAQIMNSVTSLAPCVTPSFRNFGEDPIVLSGTTPNNPGQLFQLGASLTFNCGTSSLVAYQYHMHGYVTLG